MQVYAGGDSCVIYITLRDSVIIAIKCFVFLIYFYSSADSSSHQYIHYFISRTTQRRHNDDQTHHTLSLCSTRSVYVVVMTSQSISQCLVGPSNCYVHVKSDALSVRYWFYFRSYSDSIV